KGPIPLEFRIPMGNRIFGCDDCLAVCPWNKFASAAQEAKLKARKELSGMRLSRLAELDEAGFRALFAASPVKRLGHARFLRNVLVALGNSGLPENRHVAERRMNDLDPLVRGAAVWAARRLSTPEEGRRLKAAHLPGETDPDVRAEWAA